MILVIDNYDSFTYNLVQYLGQNGAEVEVRRNDEIDLASITSLRPDGIMLSPGPCTPRESGVCLSLVRAVLDEKIPELEGVPIFGVCLGHQAVAHVAGGIVDRARRIMHGKASLIRHDGQGLFSGMPNPFTAIRYHSLALHEGSLPSGFTITARSTDDDEIMGIRHNRLPVESVQFHPESALTEGGGKIIQNFVELVNLRLARA